MANKSIANVIFGYFIRRTCWSTDSLTYWVIVQINKVIDTATWHSWMEHEDRINTLEASVTTTYDVHPLQTERTSTYILMISTLFDTLLHL